MTQQIDKLSPKPLPEQLCAILRKRISDGIYPAGTRIEGVRKIASELNVSQVTVLKAMEQLEREKYLVRIPARGVFVAEQIPRGKPKRVVFVFPEKSISPDVMTPECWALSSELHRGLLCEAQEHNIQVFFDHVDDHLDELRTYSEMSRLQEYDAAVFVGLQLWTLQQALLRLIPVYQIGSLAHPQPGVITVDYDRDGAIAKLLEHVQAQGYRSIGTLVFPSDEPDMTRRESEFRRLAAEQGEEATLSNRISVPTEPKLMYQFLVDYFRCGNYPEFLFCNNAEYILTVYEALQDLNLRPGREVGLAGIATGLSFLGLLPSYTYVKVPMFDMGRAIIRQIATGRAEAIAPVPAPLIVGKSTRNQTCAENLKEGTK